MRFLISNYSNPWNTESYYFNAGLNLIGEKSNMLDGTKSIYDNFDINNPDMFITHVKQISKDILHYIANNKKDLTLALNSDGANEEELNSLSSSLSKFGINALFFGTNDIKLSAGKYTKIMESADIFLSTQRQEYEIDKLIFIDSENEIEEMDCTRHYTTTNQNLFNIVDFVLPINTLNSIFPNYKEIIFKSSTYIGTQISFNAIYSGTKVIFDINDTNSSEKINDIFKGQKLLSSVKSRHTCLNRLKSLMSQANYKDTILKVEREIDKI